MTGLVEPNKEDALFMEREEDALLMEPEEDALFIELEEVTQAVIATVGNMYTNLEDANHEARKVTLERTTNPESKRIVDMERRTGVQRRLRIMHWRRAEDCFENCSCYRRS
jgi:hypothetical protein